MLFFHGTLLNQAEMPVIFFFTVEIYVLSDIYYLSPVWKNQG
jgi:hypothetical protein